MLYIYKPFIVEVKMLFKVPFSFDLIIDRRLEEKYRNHIQKNKCYEDRVDDGMFNFATYNLAKWKT